MIIQTITFNIRPLVRQKDRKTERQKYRKREREKDRKTERQKDRIGPMNDFGMIIQTTTSNIRPLVST
jgi:hypothetical protein